MDWWWWLIPGFLALVGGITLLAGLGAVFGGRPISGLLRTVGGGAVAAAGVIAGLVGMDVQTYQRLTFERPVATIRTEQIGPRHFSAELTEPPSEVYPDGRAGIYDLYGDEWRVEARVLKWEPWANVLGLDSQYQLDRLSGRYIETEDELNARRSVHSLRPPRDPRLERWWIDAWRLGRRFPFLGEAVDTLYGSGAAMPMVDGGEYEVWITQTGLIARPANPAAEEATLGGGWW